MSWLLAFLGFAVLIVLHEAGHFAAAKAVGMRVEKFMLFFGRPLVGFQRGETYYGVGWIPAGGFVKITGMNPMEELDPQVAPRAYYRQPVWKRLVVIAAGPAVNLVLAFLILGALYWSTGEVRDNGTRVLATEAGSPAAEVLREGDTLLAVDGRTGSKEDFSRLISRHRCAGAPTQGCRAEDPVRLTIERGGQRQTVTAFPEYDRELKRTRLGFGFGERVDVGPGRAADLSIDAMWEVTSATVGVIVRLFYDEQARDEVGGIAGSYEATRQSFEVDTTQAIFILGLISLSLAVVNLFPFLPLDGGHIFWALAEKVRGRAIPFRWMERASIVGFVLILMLFAIGLENDVDRIRNDELGVR